ncbi:hypothetical protein GCM10007920_29610 [Ciceribacter naphthalenivorans]|uniref:Uncharacterized protein n=2 Tax=Alphaproteobacteria TaxID=28211 RepID=A0A512HNL8_9HYPH|nr:hypothetical protein RNA01_39730 [Ciceribacter naphthalenivorans]GLR23173.1 hypothetical protein GCM10007920_29610 [Ciceribacter naphthalenivorans]GLT06029.1 hypothetical protein GCM10007926_29610 [Sphingomonas psychrolutea]
MGSGIEYLRKISIFIVRILPEIISPHGHGKREEGIDFNHRSATLSARMLKGGDHG